jgi:hypothetical protein
MAQEGQINLQADTLSTVPGGAMRTIIATMMVNGVLTPVQMQVVSLSDANGAILDGFQVYSTQLEDLRSEMRAIRVLLATWLGVPVIDVDIPRATGPTVISGSHGA